MRVCVWGAGVIGHGTVYRLVSSPFVSELRWINRTLSKVASAAIDLRHGLAFAPTCRRIVPYDTPSARRALDQSDLVVLCLGEGVQEGETRADCYVRNRGTFRETVIPALTGWEGIVVVVTNHVDLLARLVHDETKLDSRRTLGLGTVVETARARHAIGESLFPSRPAREVTCYCVGTHDEHFVLVPPRPLGQENELPEETVADIRAEVAKGASRVKKAGAEATLHPIAEGIAAVVDAIASDAHTILTVSVLDPESEHRIFYSMPCTLGRGGIEHRHAGALSELGVEVGLNTCIARMEDTLRAAGEI